MFVCKITETYSPGLAEKNEKRERGRNRPSPWFPARWEREAFKRWSLLSFLSPTRSQLAHISSQMSQWNSGLFCPANGNCTSLFLSLPLFHHFHQLIILKKAFTLSVALPVPLPQQEQPLIPPTVSSIVSASLVPSDTTSSVRVMALRFVSFLTLSPLFSSN